MLDEYPGRDAAYLPDRLGNLTLLARSDREALGEIAPEIYLRMIEPSAQSAHLIPEDHALWSVGGVSFCEERERLMTSMLRSLLFDLGVG